MDNGIYKRGWKQRFGPKSSHALEGLQRKHDPDGSACQCDQWQGLRSNLVKLAEKLVVS